MVFPVTRAKVRGSHILMGGGLHTTIVLLLQFCTVCHSHIGTLHYSYEVFTVKWYRAKKSSQEKGRDSRQGMNIILMKDLVRLTSEK